MFDLALTTQAMFDAKGLYNWSTGMYQPAFYCSAPPDEARESAEPILGLL